MNDQDEAKSAISAMLNKKQKERITLAELKEHEIFKKHKIDFEKLLKTPRQSISIDLMSLSHSSKSMQTSNTPRASNLIDMEKQAIEKDRHRLKTLHLSFKNSANSIKLVDGDSVRKIPSSSFLLQKTQSVTTPVMGRADSSASRPQSEATPKTTSMFFKSLDSVPVDQIKTFAHASCATDPVKVDKIYQNQAEAMDNEYRRFMAAYHCYLMAMQELQSLQHKNTEAEKEIRDLESQKSWKQTALTHASEDLNQLVRCCEELEGKLMRNQERAAEKLTRQETEIASLEDEVAHAQIMLATLTLLPSKGKRSEG